MRNVLVMADSGKEYFAKSEEMLLAEGIQTVYGNPLKVEESELIEQAAGAQTVIAGSERWTRKVLENCKDLKLLVRCGTGYDGIDVEAASELGIMVANTPGLNTYAVAEMALTMMLCLQRKVKTYDRLMRAGKWGGIPVRELREKTVGLIGFGGIAKQLAGLLQPFSCRIIAYDVYQDKEAAARLGVEFVELDEVFSEADVISMHLPLLNSTRHMINEESLSKMKPNCILINTSRGGIIDTKALKTALEEGKIAGAGLDVHEEEPIPEDYEMFSPENVILSPHVASFTEETTVTMIRHSAQEIVNYYRAGEPENLINRDYRK